MPSQMPSPSLDPPSSILQKEDLSPSASVYLKGGKEKGGSKGGNNGRRGMRLPYANFEELPDEWAEWVAQTYGNGTSTSDMVDSEGEKFLDYWHAQPGARGVKLDWFATWRNWIRKAREQRR